MSKKITMVCDRCKAEYQCSYEKPNLTVEEYDYGELDLCPSCQQELEDWLENGRAEK